MSQTTQLIVEDSITAAHYDLKVRSMFCFRLYNKDAIIEYLLDKTADRPNMEVVTHIRGIKVC